MFVPRVGDGRCGRAGQPAGVVRRLGGRPGSPARGARVHARPRPGQEGREGAHLLRVVARLRAPRRRSRGGLPRRGLVLEVQPAYGIRIFRDHFESEVGALDRRTVAVELLVGDYPDPSGSEEHPIPPEQWAACEQRDSVLVDPVCLAFDTSRRRTSIAAAGRNADGYWASRCSRSSARTGSRASSPTWRGTPRPHRLRRGRACRLDRACHRGGGHHRGDHRRRQPRRGLRAPGRRRLRGAASAPGFARPLERNPGREGRSATAGHGAASHRTWTSRRSSPPRWHWRRRWAHPRLRTTSGSTRPGGLDGPQVPGIARGRVPTRAGLLGAL